MRITFADDSCNILLTAESPLDGETKKQAEQIIADAGMIVGYNIPFVLGVLAASGIETLPFIAHVDVLEEFVSRKNFFEASKTRFVPLAAIAAHYEIEYSTAADSEKEAQAICRCLESLINDRHWRGYRALKTAEQNNTHLAFWQENISDPNIGLNYMSGETGWCASSKTEIPATGFDSLMFTLRSGFGLQSFN